MLIHSPDVKVVETDLSEIISNSADTVIAAFAGNFEKGPMNAFIHVTNVTEFISIYGRPSDKNYNDWYQVYNFLQYRSGRLSVCRIGGVDSLITPLLLNGSWSLNGQHTLDGVA